MASVLGGDEVHGTECFECAEGDVREISDGSCDEVEHEVGLPAFGDG